MSWLRWSMVVALAVSAATAAPAKAGKMLVVDYDQGLVYPLEDSELAHSPIVTNPGMVLRGKYLGTFRISEKVADKRSNMYNVHGDPISPGEKGASMPYWMRISDTAQGFHYSYLFSPTGPRHRSHGCYRLSKENALWLFHWTPVGTPVVVVKSVCTSGYAYLGGDRCGAAVASRGGPSGRAKARRPLEAEAPRRPRVKDASRKRLR